MTKEKLEKMRALRTEIRLLEKDLRELPHTRDCVQGSMTEFPYIKVTIPVTGVDETLSRALRRKIENKIAKLQKELNEFEDWLDSIEEPEMRVIMRMYYGQGFTQEAIGEEIGYSRETVYRKLKNFDYSAA